MRRIFGGEGATIRGNSITVRTKPNRRRGKHKGQMATAEGNVEIEITKQHTVSVPSDSRPKVGTIIKGDRVNVNSRWIGKIRRSSKNPKQKEVDVDKGFDVEVIGKNEFWRSRI